jgi:hypothetical protein
MKPGHYQITISKPGFDDKILDFDVVADEKEKIWEPLFGSGFRSLRCRCYYY